MTSRLDKRLAARRRNLQRPTESVDDYIARLMRGKGKPPRKHKI